MTLLSLDQSFKTTGFSIFEDDKLVHYGSWTISSNKDLGVRLRSFLDALDKTAKKYDVDEVAFEDIQLQMGNVLTYQRLAYAQAMILYWCETNNVPYVILSPSHWRAVIKDNYGVSFGRKRAEQKQKTQEWVGETYGYSPTEDEADSIALGTAAILDKKKASSAF